MHWSLPLFLLLLWSRGASSEKPQARGMDEGPWSNMMMDPQPEILIVKDKGSPAPAPAKDSGMGMKDLAPLLCLLAPLLLAAIMIPAKMSMMMNMMNGGGMMIPMPMFPGGMLPQPMLPGGMLPGGMLPQGMLPGGMLPGGPFGRMPDLLRLLLLSGNSPTQLPAHFGTISKDFGGELKVANATQEEDEKCKTKLCRELKKLAKKTGGKKGEDEDEKSRVWAKREFQNESLAEQIIDLVDRIEKMLSGEENEWGKGD